METSIDSNIYDLLDAEEVTRNRIAEMIADGNIEVVASPVIVDELRESTFGSIPHFFRLPELQRRCALSASL